MEGGQGEGREGKGRGAFLVSPTRCVVGVRGGINVSWACRSFTRQCLLQLLLPPPSTCLVLPACALRCAAQLSAECQRRFACSTTVSELPGKGNGHEVVLQVRAATAACAAACTAASTWGWLAATAAAGCVGSRTTLFLPIA